MTQTRTIVLRILISILVSAASLLPTPTVALAQAPAQAPIEVATSPGRSLSLVPKPGAQAIPVDGPLDTQVPTQEGAHTLKGPQLQATATPYPAQVGPNDFRISQMGPVGELGYAALEPRLAYNGNSQRYLVVWTGDEEGNNQLEIYGQILSASTGASVGSRFRVARMGATGVYSDCMQPSVAYNSSSNEFLVVWSGSMSNTLAGEYEVFGQRLSGAGALQGGPFRISTSGPDGDTTYDAYSPDVACNATDNEYVVVWSADTNTGSLVEDEFEIYAQRVSSAGALAGSVVRVSDMGTDGNAAYDAHAPRVAWNSTSNEYAVVWWGDDNTGSLVDEHFEIWAQRLSNVLAEVGTDDMRVSTTSSDGDTTQGAVTPAIAYSATGNSYLVVWAVQGTGCLLPRSMVRRSALRSPSAVPRASAMLRTVALPSSPIPPPCP